jgi:hypothetical protein
MPNETTTEQPKGKKLLSWTFHEYPKRARTSAWYLLAVPIAIALVVWALLTQNPLFAIFVVFAGILLVRQHRNEPEKLTFAIFEDGVTVHDHHFYSFRDLEKYWMVYEPPEVKQLYLTFKSGFRPRLTVPLGMTNPLAVREALSPRLPEDFESEGEPTTEAIARFLKL